MLRVKAGKIVPVKLRGINFGGWLMMEGYILGGRNIPEHIFKEKLVELFGRDFVSTFSRRFRDNFIQDDDYEIIKKLGFNCVRLPFNYRLLEEEGGLDYLKRVVRQIAKRKLYVILDMHAIPGAQNQDWHSDSSGEALFWEQEKYRREYFALWEKLAKTFRDEEWIAGYDIMNEPVTKDVKLLREVYQQVIEVIRESGDPHLIFLEGNNWAREISFLKGIKGDNLALSVHFYEPVEFTFNWLPDVKYPGKVLNKRWDKKAIRGALKKYADFAKELERPVFVGEFGIASRCVYGGEEFQWVEDALAAFEEFDFHWTYWTYKSVKGMDLPDGFFQLADGSGIIGTKSIVSGMENFYSVLRQQRADFFCLWRTENFKLNRFLFSKMKKYLPAIS